MNPSEYANTVLLPTVQDFFAARGDRRLAYLSCIATYHLADYIAHARGVALNQIFSEMLASSQQAWRVVHGLCNGTKHPGRRGIAPGAERDIPVMAYGVAGGYGFGRWGGIPGLEVELDDGTGRWAIVDDCVGFVLKTFVHRYLVELADVDLSFLGKP